MNVHWNGSKRDIPAAASLAGTTQPSQTPPPVPSLLRLPVLSLAAVIVAVGLASVAAFALVRRSRRRSFTAAGGNSSKFSRFDDEAHMPAAGQPNFTATVSPQRTASLPHVELSPGGTARGTAQPDAQNPWARSVTF